jgi:hypothetical protein
VPERDLDVAARFATTCFAILALAAVAIGCTSTTGPGVTPASTAPDTTLAPDLPDTAATSPVPTEPDCGLRRLEGDLGPLGHARCDGEWAAVQPVDYTDSCIDCESMWLARWDGTAWMLRAHCHAFVVLDADGRACRAISGGFPDESDIGDFTDGPSAETACAIWDFNTAEEALDDSGCDAP